MGDPYCVIGSLSCCRQRAIAAQVAPRLRRVLRVGARCLQDAVHATNRQAGRETLRHLSRSTSSSSLPVRVANLRASRCHGLLSLVSALLASTKCFDRRPGATITGQERERERHAYGTETHEPVESSLLGGYLGGLASRRDRQIDGRVLSFARAVSNSLPIDSPSESS